jgi:hypothetical protein
LGRPFFVYWNSAGGTMLTFGLSLASTDEAGTAGGAGGEADSSALANSRGAGGGRGGLKVGPAGLIAEGLRSVERDFGFRFAAAGASLSP